MKISTANLDVWDVVEQVYQNEYFPKPYAPPVFVSQAWFARVSNYCCS